MEDKKDLKNQFTLGHSDLNPMFGGPPGAQPSSTKPFFPSNDQGNLLGPGHSGFGPYVNDPYAESKQPRPSPNPFSNPPKSRYDPFGPPGHNHFGPDHDQFNPPQ